MSSTATTSLDTITSLTSNKNKGKKTANEVIQLTDASESDRARSQRGRNWAENDSIQLIQAYVYGESVKKRIILHFDDVLNVNNSKCQSAI